MVFLKFLALVAFVMFNISFALPKPKRYNDNYFNEISEKAKNCKTGKTYEVKVGGCQKSCKCLVPGIMNCGGEECDSNEDGKEKKEKKGKNKDGKKKKEEKKKESKSFLEGLRDDATNCKKGQKIVTEGCGKCTCVSAGILNCQIKTDCLPKHAQ